MAFKGINRRVFVQEFFAWWGMCIVFLIALLLVTNLAGISHGTLSHDFLLGVDLAALGSLMAVSHYHLLYLPFFKNKKYMEYLLFAIVLFVVFVLLDASLLWAQTSGRMYFSGPLNTMFVVNAKRVLIVYVPITVLNTISHIFQAGRKANKNS